MYLYRLGLKIIKLHYHEVNMFEVLQNLIKLAFKRKKFWLLPLIIFIFVFGTLILLTESPVIAPFIYTII